MNTKALKQKVGKIGVPAVAKASGVNRTTLYEWLKHPTQNLGVDRHNAVVKAVQELTNEPETAEMVKIGGEEFLPVPIFDIRAAAGAGAFADDGDPIAYQAFRLSFLQRLTRAALSHLSVIEVAGDSMEPTIYGGDQVLVDHSIRTVDHGGLYILRLDDANIVKRCEKDYSTKAVQIISDNQRYPIQTVKSSDRLQVIGRVIWIGRALR